MVFYFILIYKTDTNGMTQCKLVHCLVEETNKHSYGPGWINLLKPSGNFTYHQV
jgi:hypothetical protein